MGRAIAAILGSAEAAQWRSFSGIGRALEAFWHELTRDVAQPYHPERYYMRGPGPAWRAKHGSKPEG